MDYKIFLVFYLGEEKITFPLHVAPMKSEVKKTYNISPLWFHKGKQQYCLFSL